MKIDTKTIQKLRAKTGVGIMNAKRALQESSGDYDKAVEFLKKQGQKVAAKKQERQTKEGIIGYYIHANGKIAALVAVACESDFVAKTDDFKELAHDLAMQVAAVNPEWIKPEDIPLEIIKKEKELIQENLPQNKPQQVQDKIIQGKLNKFF